MPGTTSPLLSVCSSKLSSTPLETKSAVLLRGPWMVAASAEGMEIFTNAEGPPHLRGWHHRKSDSSAAGVGGGGVTQSGFSLQIQPPFLLPLSKIKNKTKREPVESKPSKVNLDAQFEFLSFDDWPVDL